MCKANIDKKTSELIEAMIARTKPKDNILT